MKRTLFPVTFFRLGVAPLLAGASNHLSCGMSLRTTLETKLGTMRGTELAPLVGTLPGTRHFGASHASLIPCSRLSTFARA